MSTDLFKKILDEHQELSSVPQTLAEVLRVAKDDDSSAQDLAEVLQRDPALTAKILRLVNSPFYGMSRKITSVRQAVVTLGMRAVTAVALSTSIYDMTGKWQTAIDRMRFWRHSLEVAVAARMIAEAVKYASSEEAFVCGLLHDLGVLILEKSFSEDYRRICHRVEEGRPSYQLEEDRWGTNHARVGQFLLEQWNLPAALCDAIGRHHDNLSEATSDASAALPQIVFLANLISQFTILPGQIISPDSIDSKQRLVESLKLDPERMAEIEREHLSKTLDLAGFLEIDIGSQSDLLVEANRMLYQQYGALESLLGENRDMQQHLALAKLDKAALDTLKTITATFNHYINNAVGTILGRAQLVEASLHRGEVTDRQGVVTKAIDVIICSVETIQAVVEELGKLTTFKTATYYNETQIIDIESRLRKKLSEITREVPSGQ